MRMWKMFFCMTEALIKWDCLYHQLNIFHLQRWGWKAGEGEYFCMFVCVFVCELWGVCVMWQIKWLSLTSFASELKRTIWTSANNHWRNTKYLKTMLNDLPNPFAHFGNEHNNTDNVKSLPNTISGYLLRKHIKWVKKIIKVFLVYFQEVNS